MPSGPTIQRGQSSGDIWTPQVFIDAVERRFGKIDIDLAASESSRKAELWLSVDQDSLSISWSDLCTHELAVNANIQSQLLLSSSANVDEQMRMSQLKSKKPKSVIADRRKVENGNVDSQKLTTTSDGSEDWQCRGIGIETCGSSARLGGKTLAHTAEKGETLRKITSSRLLMETVPEQSLKTSSQLVSNATLLRVTDRPMNGVEMVSFSPRSKTISELLCFLNPPYSNITPWAKKCVEESLKGAQILLLVPGSIGANWYWDHVEPFADVYSVGRMVFDNCFDREGKLVTTAYPKDLILAYYRRLSINQCQSMQRWKWK